MLQSSANHRTAKPWQLRPDRSTLAGLNQETARVSASRKFVVLALVPFATIAAQSNLPSSSTYTAPHQRLAHEVYKELVEINTSDSVGNVTTAAEAMAKRFRAAGFPEQDVQVLVPRADKGNLVVRYRGSGARKPLLLLAHLDVVAALKSDWSPELDPFKMIEREGWFYGRGTSDDKAMAAIFVANLLRMKQEGYVPDRDLILALTADEEGGPVNGVRWLVANKKELIDAAYALNEGGGGSLKDMKPFLHSVQATEKVSANFVLTAKNKGGHSSVPRDDNAIYQLAEALTKVGKYHFPVELNEVTKAFFEKTASVETPEVGAAMRALVKNPADAKASAIVSAQPRYNSMLRTTCVATRLTGGHANNALPQTATANINCRMVPNKPPEEVRASLARAINDTGITISQAPQLAASSPSPLLPELFEPVERITKEMWGNIPVIPTMSTGATDGRMLRTAGIPTYGVSGLFGDPNDARAHGRDERMLVRSFFEGQEFLYRLVKELSSPTKPKA
jgi:acetylornithine deacetylase/succinyl-diaminopimelate desuccinylase-like protein